MSVNSVIQGHGTPNSVRRPGPGRARPGAPQRTIPTPNAVPPNSAQNALFASTFSSSSLSSGAAQPEDALNMLVFSRPRLGSGPGLTFTASRTTNRPKASARPVHTHTDESTILYKGKLYHFTLEIPTQADLNKLSAEEKKELEAAVLLYKKKFIEHLNQQNDKAIEPGKSFDILFTENGYTASTVPTDKSTPETFSLDTPEANQFSLLLRSNSSTIKGIIDLLKTETNYSPPGATTGSTSTTSASQSSAAPTTPGSPVPPPQQIDPNAPPVFTGPTNSCYLISATHALASNPFIRQELLKEGALPKDHPFRQVLQNYENGKPPTNLEALQKALNLRSGTQEDAQETILKLMEPVKSNGISCPMKREWSHRERTSFLRRTHKEVWHPEGDGKFTSQLPMIPVYPQEEIKLSVDGLFRDALQISLENSDPRSVNGKEVTPYREKTTFQTAPNVLFVHVQRTQKDKGKINTAIEDVLHPTLPKACIKEGDDTEYELTSFTQHLGTTAKGGHYLTYVKNVDVYSKINSSADGNGMISKTETSTQQEFEHAAKLAYDLIYMKVKSEEKSTSLGNGGGTFTTQVSNNLPAALFEVEDGTPVLYKIPDDVADNDAIYIQLKKQLAEMVAYNRPGKITLISTEKIIKRMNDYVAELKKIAKDKKLEVGDFTVEASDDNANLNLTGEKTNGNPDPNNRQPLRRLYTLLVGNTSKGNAEQLTFNLRATGLAPPVSDQKLYCHRGDLSNEQTTLETLLTKRNAKGEIDEIDGTRAIQDTHAKGKKVRLLVSRDILIKNMERIKAALDAADKLSKSAEGAVQLSQPAEEVSEAEEGVDQASPSASDGTKHSGGVVTSTLNAGKALLKYFW